MLPILSALGSTTLTQLVYAVAIDTHKHFGRAAEACNVTQPTLSMQIGKLESSLGVVLFDRTRSPVLTTDVGKVLIEQARIILLESARLTDIRDQLSGSVAGELRIGIIPTLAPSILPRIIPAMSKRYPDLLLTVLEEKTEDVVDRLNDDSIDVGILGSDVTSAKEEDSVRQGRIDQKGRRATAGDRRGDRVGMIEIPLFDEPFVGFVSDSHRLFARVEIRASDLSTDDLWLLSEGHCFRSQAISLCSESSGANRDFEAVSDEDINPYLTAYTPPTVVKNSGNLSTRFEIGHLTTLVRLVEQGLGMTLLPALAAADLPQDLQDKFVRKFADPAPYRTVRLVRRRLHYKDHLVGAMVEVLTQELPADIVNLANQKI